MKIPSKQLQFVLAVMTALFLHVIFSNEVSAAWYNGDWLKRVKITIDSDKVNGDLSNFPVYVDLSDLPDEFFDDVAANGADLRVTKSDETTEVAREVVYVDTTNNAGELHFVANGTLSGSSNSDWYLYYDNSSASEPAEDATYGSENVWNGTYLIVHHLNEEPVTSDGTVTFYDSTHNDYDAKEYGSMTSDDLIDGQMGKCIDFDGSNDYIESSSAISELASLAKYTMSGWYKKETTTGGDKVAMAFFQDSSNHLTLRGNNSREYTIEQTGSLYGGNFAHYDTSWHLFAAVFNGDFAANNDELDLYHDGIDQNVTAWAPDTLDAGFSSAKQVIGYAEWGGERHDGYWDEVRFSLTPMTGEWLWTEYNNQSSPSTFYSVAAVENAPVPPITASSYSPTHDATGVSLYGDLQITFSESTNIQTGNITIKKDSDDSTFETIDITSSNVTGNGTTILTINPTNGFAASTDYYVEIDASAIDGVNGGSFAGISGNGTWSFTTTSNSATAFTWIGSAPGGDNNWSTDANWYGGTAPGGSDIAVFNDVSTKDSTIDAAISVGGIDINAGYTGTITQTSGNGVTISGSYAQDAGTFTGSDSSIDINSSGSFTLAGGTFTSTSDTLSVERNFTYSGGTFNHNSGTVTFDGSYNNNATIDANGVTFSTVSINRSFFSADNKTLTITAGTVLPLANSATVTYNNTNSKSGTIANSGTITLGTGTTTFSVDGSLTNSGTINGSSTTVNANSLSNSGTVNLPNVTTIDLGGSFTNSASGSFSAVSLTTLNVAGSVTIDSGSTFGPTGATLNLDGALTGNYTIDTGGFEFAAATLNRTFASGDNKTLTIGANTVLNFGNDPTITYVNSMGGKVGNLTNSGTIVVGTGTFTESVEGTFTNNGTIRTRTTTLSGSIVHASGSTIEFIGDNDAAADTFTISDFQTDYYNLSFNADDGASDVFTLGADITVSEDWTNTAGTFNGGAYTVTFDGTDQTINGSSIFYNFTKTESSDDSTDETLTFTVGDTYTIKGTLTLDGRDSDDRINIVSSSGGSQFEFDLVGGSQVVDYLDVIDSESSSNNLKCISCVDSGNTDNGEASPHWVFTDITDMSLDPADNETGINPSKSLTMTFNTNANLMSGSIEIYQNGGALFEDIDVNTDIAQISGNGTTTLVINPTSDFLNNKTYYVHIDATAIDDDYGNSYVGISSNTYWDFTIAPPAPDDWYSGSWEKRTKITINSSYVNGDLSNFPIYVDLSDLPDAFFDNVNSDGSDIRVTKSDGATEVAREIVAISTTDNTGEMHFVANGTLSSSSDTVFYIYYGNSSATEPASDATYGSENVWTQGYLAVWHMTQDPTGSVTDSTSYEHHLTSSGSMTSGDLVAGQVGNGLDLDGADDYLYVAGNANLQPTNITMDVWAESDDATAANYVSHIAYRATSGSHGYLLRHYSGSTKVESYIGISNSWNNTEYTPSSITTFHKITSTYDGSSTRLYLDGSYQANDTSPTGNITYSSMATNLIIGSDTTNTSTREYDGVIDEVRISGEARSDDWIETEYNNQSSPSTFYTAESTVSDLSTIAVLSFSPSDNGTISTVSDNLVITFDREVYTMTGNITIKTVSGDSIVEAIDVTSGQVTGNGTTTITINPSSDFSMDTDYYVEIDATAFDDSNDTSYAGFTSNGTWNFSTPGWYDLGWNKRIKLTIDSSKISSDLTNFPVYVDLSTFGDGFFNDVLANGADMRVTKSDGTTELAREVVSLSKTDNTGEMHFVANGTLSSSSDTDFYIYYGNSSATEPAEDATYGRENVWMNNFVGVWHLSDDPTGGTAYDSTANDYDGTTYGSMDSNDLLSSNGVGHAYDFDGGDDYIGLPDISSSFGDDGTLSMYLKLDSNTPSNYDTGITRLGSSTSTDHYAYSSGAYYYYSVFRNDRPGASVLGSYDKTQWHYSAVTQTPGASGYNIYYNDDNIVSGTGEPTVYMTSTPYIGRSYSSSYDYDGRMSEIRLSSVARSADWLAAEYNNWSSPSSFHSNGSSSSSPYGITSYTPTDDSTGVSVSDNLILVFNKNTDQMTGNVTIKKLSDDTTVEAISVASGQVTGNGTTTITINPSSNLDYSTDYYVTIDSTAFDSNGGESYAGFSNNGTWNFTTSCNNSITNWFDCSWQKRVKITIDSDYVNGDLSNFPVYVDLGDLNGTAGFFENLNSDGSDIRVTKSDGTTEVAREIVAISTTNNTGEMHFVANGTLSGSSDTDFYIYFANSSATEPAEDATYGRENVWTQGYVAVWHLEEDGNTTASGYNDATSNDNDGTGVSMTSSSDVTAKLGKGQDFDGSADYISAADSSSLDITVGTLSAWINFDSDDNVGYPTPLCKAPVNDAYLYVVNADEDPIWRIERSGQSHTDAEHNSNVVQIGSWDYWSGTYDGSTMRFYRGGYQKATNSVAGTIAATTGAFYMGDSGGGGNDLDGKLDEVRISSIARTAAWIDTEYNNQNSPSTFYSTATVEDKDTVEVYTLSPTDDATEVAVDSNLVITFNRAVYTMTGNVYIKQISDDTTVETIAIGDAAITGNGTTSITINPGSDLEGETSYYVTIQASALDDAAGNSYTGISDNGTWNFTTEATNAAWVNSNYAKRIKLTVNSSQVNGDLTDFPVYLDLSDLSSNGFFANIRSDGGDIRVTQGDGMSLVPTELVSVDTTNNQGELWFKAPFLSGSSNTNFYVYYNNPNGTPLNADHPLGMHNVWTNGYVAVYHMNQDPSTGVIYNSVSNSLHGTPSGSMTSGDKVAGQVGNGTDFDGSDDYIDMGDLANTSPVTLSTWFKADDDSDRRLTGQTSGATTQAGSIRYNSSDIEVWDGSSWDTMVSGGVSTGAWYSLAITYDSGSTQAYLSGVAKSSGSSDFDFSGVNFGLASKYTGSFGSYFDGVLDELHVSNKLRSEAWLDTEYNNQNSASTFYTVGEAPVSVDDDSIPKVFLTYPRNRQDRFPLRANLFIEFNETVQAGSGNITIYESNGSSFEAIAIGSATISGSRVTVDPSSNLVRGTEYYVLIDDGAIEDTSSNPFPGISDSDAWRFSTEGGNSTSNTPASMFLFGE